MAHSGIVAASATSGAGISKDAQAISASGLNNNEAGLASVREYPLNRY